MKYVRRNFTEKVVELDKVAQGDSGVVLNENIQYLTGQCPEQPAVVSDPALAREAGLDNIQRCLLTSAVV